MQRSPTTNRDYNFHSINRIINLAGANINTVFLIYKHFRHFFMKIFQQIAETPMNKGFS